MSARLRAGAATADITPRDSQFLFGYPHVERWSTGVHRPLFASALYLSDGATPLLTIGCDVLFVDRELTARARGRIEQATGVPAANITVTATHTHSGPLTTEMLCMAEDPVIPAPDAGYLRLLEDGVVQSAIEAVRKAFDAEIGLVVANGSCVGTNRHDPQGPSDPDVPVLAIRRQGQSELAAVMLICAMHPTVLHEDSTLVSSDFPGAARAHLQRVFGDELPVIYHIGVAGDQSPRHITRANTTAEADRIGTLLGKAIEASLRGIQFTDAVSLGCLTTKINLPPRRFPSVTDAEATVDRVRTVWDQLRSDGADPRATRTVECQLFGAEETLTFSRAQSSGAVAATIDRVLPAEITAFQVGPWSFLFWPGELFVEFGLEVRSQFRDAFIATMANSDLQGYLVTAEAVEKETYEALNALFASPESGRLVVESSVRLLNEVRRPR